MSHRPVTPPAPLQPARAVDPSAGDHLVTGDAAELAAAERAVHRSWAEFPYYARRFGTRGRSFSSSDSGWLATLRERRLARIDQGTLRDLESGFDAAVAPGELRRLRRMGGILVTAVADERDGIELAASSVVGSATDPDRFGRSWITAVHETVAEARTRAR